MTRVVFIGAIRRGKMPICGETAKNQILLNRFETLLKRICVVDTYKWKRNPYSIMRLFCTLLFMPKSYFVISVYQRSAYRLFQLLQILHLKRNIIYWAIGGAFADMIKAEKFSAYPYKIVDKFIVEGKKMQSILYEYGFKNVYVVPNTKPILYIPPKKRKAQTIRFVFLSRIIPEKGCDYICRSAKEINELGYTDKYIIDFYGSIDKHYEVLFKAQLDCLPNVNYKGFLNLQSVENYDVLASYDVMLFPTYYPSEGFPGVIIDAFIAGLPVIASDWNFNNEVVIHNKNGILIPAKDVLALQQAMLRYINDYQLVLSHFDYCRGEVYKYGVDEVLSEKLFQQLGLLK